MSEKESIFSSKIKVKGVFSFKALYEFCYGWLNEESGLDLVENEYSEKLAGDSKGIDVKWTGTKKVTDYFKFEVVVKFKVTELTNIDIVQGGAKVSTNKGAVEISVKGNLIRDYQGKFERDAYRKFLRSIYEKWVIPARIEEYEGKLINSCDDFLNQAKAYLDLEGKK